MEEVRSLSFLRIEKGSMLRMPAQFSSVCQIIEPSMCKVLRDSAPTERYLLLGASTIDNSALCILCFFVKYFMDFHSYCLILAE